MSSSLTGLGGRQVRAAVVDAPGADPKLGSVGVPPRSRGTSVVAVHAAPLNPLDLAIASGAFHSVVHEAPYVPGSECVGSVIESDTYAPGTLVYGECHASPSSPGTFAELVVLRDESILVLPSGVDPVRAAAVGNAGVAAYLPLIDRAHLQRGETVLILGATGAVGQLAVQIARLRGAGRVVGVARDAQALSRVQALGADAVVQLRENEAPTDLGVRISKVAGEVDVVLDGLWGRPLEAAISVCAPGARIVNIGNMAGPTAVITAGALRGKQVTLSGFAGLRTTLREKAEALGWLWQSLLDDALEITVRTLPLDDLPTAWSAQAESPHGKLVLVPSAVADVP